MPESAPTGASRFIEPLVLPVSDLVPATFFRISKHGCIKNVNLASADTAAAHQTRTRGAPAAHPRRTRGAPEAHF